jgi:glutathione S-transferase
MGQSRKPTVFGAPYSVYVRSVRLTLEEKAVDYDLVPVDIFAAGGPPREQVARHQFGKIPAFEHDSFRLYEAGAIARYIDEAFAGVPLQPADVRGRARMTQIISILDSYA